ncbi:MAG TPA: class I SAM-dependent methyltransferase [Candidatus Nanoarchaeia archaeon]|nr:class I SAM-dependent methyltransferase [Candidatus Nanoarchaeia archaeon]
MIIVDLGCGSKETKVTPQVLEKVSGIKVENSTIVGVDLSSETEYNVDLEKGKLPFRNESVDMFYSSHTFEHLYDIEHIMREIYRCIRPDGLLVVRVPHYSAPNAKTPFHKLYYSYNNSFAHYIPKVIAKKHTEHYSHVRFNYVKRRLRFGRFFRFYAEPLFNLFPLFYERYLSGIFPCDELLFVMKPVK